ncbi:MAG: Ig-like domain-containing protein [Actinomycetales bacterium]
MNVRPAMASLITAACVAGLPFAPGTAASASEPKVQVKVGPAEEKTGSVRVRVHLSEQCYDGFADFPDRCADLSLEVPANPTHGTITRKRWSNTSGAFTYTPTDAARHQASSLTATSSDKRERFRVRVSAGRGRSWSAPVTIVISPRNSPPVLSSGYPIVGAPDAQGVITGRVGATDADADPLSYTVTTPPTRGSVTINPDGSFTYVPTAAAVQEARPANPSTDTFTVTVSDGHGGSIQVPITCPAAP